MASPALAHHKDGHAIPPGHLKKLEKAGAENEADDVKKKTAETKKVAEKPKALSTHGSSKKDSTESSKTSAVGSATKQAAIVTPTSSKGRPPHGCEQAKFNDGDPFDSTCDRSPALNGGKVHKNHCAGCVGAADNKNPPGQSLNDHNNGYECDGNNGIGRGNPAHSRCAAAPPPPPKPPRQTVRVKQKLVAVVVPPQVKTRRPQAPPPPPSERLPVTGMTNANFLALGLVLVAVGALLEITTRKKLIDR